MSSGNLTEILNLGCAYTLLGHGEFHHVSARISLGAGGDLWFVRLPLPRIEIGVSEILGSESAGVLEGLSFGNSEFWKQCVSETLSMGNPEFWKP